MLKVTRDKKRERERDRFVKCKIIILISPKHLFFYPPKCFHFAGDIFRLKRLLSSQDPEGHTGGRVTTGRAFLARHAQR